MKLEKFSFGIGDRFAKEGIAQLQAIKDINELGVDVVPVWNKSYREHTTIKTSPESVLNEARHAVKDMDWSGNYYVDADHITMETVDEFIGNSNFFTIDVAHFISGTLNEEDKNEFVGRYLQFIGKLVIPTIEEEITITRDYLETAAKKYLPAIAEVTRIYNYIASRKGKDNFVAEVSMDETSQAQTPVDLFFILAELKYKGVDVQTIAPKFTGLFAKGIDYIGSVSGFAKEFEQDVAVVKYAIDLLGLTNNLKLSVHSGSDKFSLYPVIRRVLKKLDTGIHVKTAGTTWLEEVSGLAGAGGEGLQLAKTIYKNSLNRYEELTSPYATVLDINKDNLPDVQTINTWDSSQFVNTLTHDQACKDYNPDFRQLLHVGYKIAAEMGNEFISALIEYRPIIAENVRYNLLERHLKPLFQ